MAVGDKDAMVPDKDMAVEDGEGVPEKKDIPEGAHKAKIREKAVAWVTTAHVEFTITNIYNSLILILHITLYNRS